MITNVLGVISWGLGINKFITVNVSDWKTLLIATFQGHFSWQEPGACHRRPLSLCIFLYTCIPIIMNMSHITLAITQVEGTKNQVGDV